MAIDWDEVEKENKKFKNYAPVGENYKVKCVDVEIHEVGSNGSIAQDFIFEEDKDYKYPKATHWLTFKPDKISWRRWHNLNLMIILGADKETAKKTIEKIEAFDDKDKIVKGYSTAYKTLIGNGKMVEIDIFADGKYTKAEFSDSSVAMPHDKKLEAVITGDEIKDDDIDLSDIAF